MKNCGVYDGIRYLELSNSYNEVYCRINSRIYNAIFDRINYLISEKSDDKYCINHNPARIRVNSYNSFPGVIILIKSVFNRDKNNCYYNILLEKGWYKEFNTQYF